MHERLLGGGGPNGTRTSSRIIRIRCKARDRLKQTAPQTAFDHADRSPKSEETCRKKSMCMLSKRASMSHARHAQRHVPPRCKSSARHATTSSGCSPPSRNLVTQLGVWIATSEVVECSSVVKQVTRHATVAVGVLAVFGVAGPPWS